MWQTYAPSSSNVFFRCLMNIFICVKLCLHLINYFCHSMLMQFPFLALKLLDEKVSVGYLFLLIIIRKYIRCLFSALHFRTISQLMNMCTISAKFSFYAMFIYGYIIT